MNELELHLIWIYIINIVVNEMHYFLWTHAYELQVLCVGVKTTSIHDS